MNAPLPDVLKQHLIDPEICIRCNTCEDICPVDAIEHDSRNYVVKADVCNACGACISPCPTGAIDNWRLMLKVDAFSLADQYSWDELPPDQPPLDAAGEVLVAEQPVVLEQLQDEPKSSRRAPWSAAHPYVNLYGQQQPAVATVAGNYRVTGEDCDSDVHHIVLDFGTGFFPVLEGQSIGVIPPGTDEKGRAHYARQYSIASPRDGERPGYNNLSLTVKRVTTDHAGKPVRGVASNYLCDLKKGDAVQVIGPFGNSFLMPNHPGSNLLMICTGTGSAPMRAMTEHRRREGARNTGRLMLFFGARTQAELPYFGPLMKLPKDFIDVNLALSRAPGEPRRYVQDRLRERSADVAALLKSADTCLYVCGLRGMEAGVLDALRDICAAHGLDWGATAQAMQAEGRIHLETY
ncbi:benzoyl-CoA 2,3-epoxidase subunit BoxA [Derxia lacustris]|uniref:benzoyl-CoA 2,3-epoxidase subunit BoxA n=1 Tax=Derxia lacustris TaxID=764842 RepID=UPI000A1774B5|nr:benzoyl-CoA 2,3-epoxidase subunit BoxA [Derxia lacustris]